MELRGFVEEDGGFTTVGVVVTITLVLALLFTSAQVYWANSVSDDVQFAADAGALAAENVVAEYLVVARVADAVVLSLGLLGVTLYGASIVVSCIPAAQTLGANLLNAAQNVIRVRRDFAEQATVALNRLQDALPYLCALEAIAVIRANSAEEVYASYQGIAIPFPFEGEQMELTGDDIEEASGELAEHNSETAGYTDAAAEHAQRMQDSKLVAYMADCGNSPDYCLWERADSLAGLSGSRNPFYRSVDTWEFSVPLARARAYYRTRLAKEQPLDSSVAEQVRSAARTQVYAYACDMLDEAYVTVSPDGEMDARFPLLPRTTDELRASSLYTDAAYPISGDGVLHAFAACPACTAVVGHGSVAEQEQGSYGVCGTCDFTASTLGTVASASSIIDNGFEYHYRIIAQAAKDYAAASREYAVQTRHAKESAQNAFDVLEGAIAGFAAQRIDPKPPGRFGCIALVIDSSTYGPPAEFTSSLLDSTVQVGPRVAVSAAAMARDTADENGNLLTSLLDTVEERFATNLSLGIPLRLLSLMFDIWGKLLAAYGSGVDGLQEGLATLFSGIPGSRATGLSRWAGDALDAFLEKTGFQPAKLDTPKPVVVNTSYVLAADDSSYARILLDAKALVGGGFGESGGSGNQGIEGFMESFLGAEAWMTSPGEGELTLATIGFPDSSGIPPISLVMELPTDESGGDAGSGRAVGMTDSLSTRRKEEAGVWE